MESKSEGIRLVKVDTKNFDALIDLAPFESQYSPLWRTTFTALRKPMQIM